MKPGAQDWVEFWQLHTHSSTSQHLVFFTANRRCGGQSGSAWRAHSSFLQTSVGKKKRDYLCGLSLIFSLALSLHVSLCRLNITEKTSNVIPHSWIGWHSPGFFRTTIWPSSQWGTSGSSQFTRSHTTNSHKYWRINSESLKCGFIAICAFYVTIFLSTSEVMLPRTTLILRTALWISLLPQDFTRATHRSCIHLQQILYKFDVQKQ